MFLGSWTSVAVLSSLTENPGARRLARPWAGDVKGLPLGIRRRWAFAGRAPHRQQAGHAIANEVTRGSVGNRFTQALDVFAQLRCDITEIEQALRPERHVQQDGARRGAGM